MAKKYICGNMTISQYAKWKCQMLEMDMKIVLTEMERQNLMAKKTHIAIDNCARQIIADHCG